MRFCATIRTLKVVCITPAAEIALRLCNTQQVGNADFPLGQVNMLANTNWFDSVSTDSAPSCGESQTLITRMGALHLFEIVIQFRTDGHAFKRSSDSLFFVNLVQWPDIFCGFQ